MTATGQIAPASPAARPFRFAMLVPTLILGVVVPIAIFKTLEKLGVPPVWALAADSVPVLLNNLRLWIRSRRLEPIGIMTMAGVGGGAVASLVSGSLFYKILTDCLLSGAWGLAFLGSLLFSRPVMFFILRQLVAGGDAAQGPRYGTTFGAMAPFAPACARSPRFGARPTSPACWSSWGWPVCCRSTRS